MSPTSSRVPSVRAVAAAALSGVLCAGLLGANATSATAAEPVAGARTSGDSLFPHVGNGGYDVQHYDLDIAWTPGDPVESASTIAATAKISAKAPAALSEFSLDLEGLTVGSITVDGAPATWQRDVDAEATKHKLVVTPAEPVAGDFTAVVTYSGSPVTHVDPDGSSEGWVPTPDGATAVNEPVGAMTWYPVNNSLKDKATYDIKLTIPRLMDGETMAAASNGTLHAKTRDGARETWHWRQPNQMAPYLSMVSIGKYEVRESVIELESGTVRDWTFIDPAITPAQRTTTLTSLAQTEQIMRWMESHFGPYPGVSAGAVVDNLNLGYALETQDRAYYSRSVSKGTLIHEIAHQWFGNAVSPTDWSDLWLNEGMGDYAPRAYNFETGATTDSPETVYHRAWAASPPADHQWQVPLAGFDDPAIMFEFVYGRGGMTHEVLRTIVGDDDWFEILRTWVSENNGSNASTADFVALAERISGKELSPALDPWLFGTAKPAWPSQWNLTLSSAPPPGEVSQPQRIVYTISATNTGLVPLEGATAEVDASDVLDDAGFLDYGPEFEQTESTLTWSVPPTEPGAVAEGSFSVVVDAESQATLELTAAPASLGGFGTPSLTHWVRLNPVYGYTSPFIMGTARVGSVLTVNPGEWQGNTTFAYQWTIAGKPVPGATGRTFRLRPQDLGRFVRVEVTASKPGWSSVTPVAGPLKVAPGRLVRTPRPVQVGVPKVRRTLKVRPGSWDPGVRLSYRWYRGGKAIKGATRKSYTVRKSDVGQRLRVRVTARKSGYSTVVRYTPKSKKVRRQTDER